MTGFPKITRPCPYKGPLSDILDRNAVCRLCHRQVHDLSAMGEVQRAAFLKACADDVCVSYRLPAAAAALALAAAVTALPAAAQEPPSPAPSEDMDVIFVGGAMRIDPGKPTITQLAYNPDAKFGSKTVADAAKERWDETHRRHDSRRGREKRDEG